MSAARRLMRLLQIVELLRLATLTTRELADQLDVSTRSLQRDLRLLQQPPLALALRQDEGWCWHLERTPNWLRIGPVGAPPRALVAGSWLTVAQAAAALGRSTGWVQEGCRRGRFPGARRPGHDWLIPAQDLVAVVAAQRATG